MMRCRTPINCFAVACLLIAALGVGGCQLGPRHETWSPAPQPLARRVADRVIEDFREPAPFNWGEGVLMAGMMQAGTVLKEPRYVDFVGGWADHWQKTGIMSLMEERGYCGHWGPGLPVLMLYERKSDPKYLRMCEQILDFMQTRALKTSEGFPGPSNKLPQIWVDVLFMCCPVYTHLAKVTHTPALVGEGVKLLETCAQHCQDPQTGLFYHMYDEPTKSHVGPLWARGNGWVAMSCVEVLLNLDRKSPEFKRLSADYGQLVAGIVATQDKATGLWHTIQDRPDTYLETSASAMFLYSLLRAQRAGLVQVDRPVLERAWAGLATKVDPQGHVIDVSAGTDARTELDRYINKPRGTFTWGTGAFLLAATELLAR